MKTCDSPRDLRMNHLLHGGAPVGVDMRAEVEDRQSTC